MNITGEVHKVGRASDTVAFNHAPIVQGSEAVYRNGIRLARGVDYTTTSSLSVFVSPNKAQSGDIYVFDYEY